MNAGRSRLRIAEMPPEVVENGLPASIEAEEQVIGALMFAPEMLRSVSTALKPGDFTDPAHASAFRALVDMHKRQLPIDMLSVRLALEGRREFRGENSPAAYLSKTLVAVTTAAHLSYYVDVVKEKALKRRLFAITHDASRASLNGHGSDRVLAELTASLDAYRSDAPLEEVSTEQTVDEWAASVRDRIKPTMVACAPFGSRLRALEVGQGIVTTFAAPPSNGKSALACQLVFDALAQPGQEDMRALICSVEMLPAQICNRALARFSGVPYSRIRHRSYHDDDLPRIEAGIARVRGLAERIEFQSPPFTIERVAERADAFAVNLVLIDYLQRVGVIGFDDPRLAVSSMMSTCRRIADKGRAVLVISAVSRSGYAKETAGIASLRESSELEFASDSVYLLHLDDEARKQRHSSIPATLTCAKARDAELGEIPLTFVGSAMSFESEPEFAEHDDFKEFASDGRNDNLEDEGIPWT